METDDRSTGGDEPRLPVPRDERRSALAPPPAPTHGWPEEEPEYDLRRFLTVIWRRRWIILGGALPVFLLVAFQTYRTPKVYESTTSILVEPTRDVRGGPLDVLERMGQVGQLGTEMQLLTSRRVVQPVVDDLDLHVYVETEEGPARPRDVFPLFEAGPYTVPGEWRLVPTEAGVEVRETSADSLIARVSPGAALTLGGATLRLPIRLDGPVLLGVGSFNGAVGAVRNQVYLGRMPEDGTVLVLHCSGDNPNRAQELCDAVAGSYVRLRTELARMSAEVTHRFLQDQVVRLAERLTSAEDSLAAYERRNEVVALEDRVSEEVRSLAGLRAERDLLEAERSALASFLAEIEADPSRSYRELASFPSFLNDPSMGELIANLAQVENARSELAVRRTERNADLAAIIERIEEIEGQLAQVARGYERALGSSIASLDRTLAGMTARLTSVPTQQVELARLRREAGQLEQLHSFLLTRLREAELAKEVEMPAVRVLDAASLPAGPVSPKIRQNLAFGLALGLAFGLTLGFYREYYDRRISGRLEAEQQTGLPVIGMIPNVGSGLRAAAAQRRIRPVAPTQMALEAFHSLAADLRLLSRNWSERGIRSVAITSAAPKEGKTFTACNLALVHASFGLRTLIVDADMRASSVARSYGLSTAGPGLGEVLAGKTRAEEAYLEVAVDDSTSLFVLPAGTPLGHPTSLLETPAFAALIADAQRSFDVVLVDTPPLNVMSDAASIASVVDAVLFVVRSDRTDPEMVRVSLDRLSRATQNVVGVVLNDVSLPEQYSAYAYAAEEVT